MSWCLIVFVLLAPYKCLIVSLVFSHLGFWSGNLFLIAPFPDLCLLVPTYTMKHIVSRMSSYFPNRWPVSYLNLTKNMKTYIRRQQHKIVFKHQDIKQKEPSQKYRLGTISNTKLLAGLNRFYRYLTSPSASAVVHNI